MFVPGTFYAGRGREGELGSPGFEEPDYPYDIALAEDLLGTGASASRNDSLKCRA